ncbi:SDR family oxidoreductase [Sphingomonas sp. BN140010]|uniref:SDR family oxidoreductase n=1 Tax=Sphingomonas arvum TaxID=2992113 RepID=A0ABT3JEV0_9SPHN|nr:SDR family oxidoreductase [Sphingomonas sp. BN140010]MCW3797602.1 SDR family oxidoreductase [Sphingomonas sp. BN140010]
MGYALEGKVAVITGGTTGIGFATAKRFVAEGARVFITGRREAELGRAVAEIGSGLRGIQADSTVMADLDRLYAEVEAEAGRIDVLFANAGGGSYLPLGSITEEQFDVTFDRNVKGVLFTVQKALPLLVNGAAVILTGSTTSIAPVPAFSVYGASKAAIRSFARTWTLDLKARSIRVNVLSPGPTATPGLLGLAGDDAAAQQQLLAEIASQVPLGRVADPDEIASAALFLASGQSSFVTGIELFADGGSAQV